MEDRHVVLHDLKAYLPSTLQSKIESQHISFYAGYKSYTIVHMIIADSLTFKNGQVIDHFVLILSHIYSNICCGHLLILYGYYFIILFVYYLKPINICLLIDYQH